MRLDNPRNFGVRFGKLIHKLIIPLKSRSMNPQPIYRPMRSPNDFFGVGASHLPIKFKLRIIFKEYVQFGITAIKTTWRTKFIGLFISSQHNSRRNKKFPRNINQRQIKIIRSGRIYWIKRIRNKYHQSFFDFKLCKIESRSYCKRIWSRSKEDILYRNITRSCLHFKYI